MRLQSLSWLIVLGIFILPLTAGAEENFRQRVSTAISADTNLDDIKAEINFGRDVAARILGNYPRERNPALIRYINLIGKGIAANAGRPELNFTFAILDSETVNAFATPGGYIFVTKGALRLMRDESELAAVLGHEIGHVVAKHIVNELRIRAEDTEGLASAGMVSGATDPIRLALQQMVDKAVEILFERGYQRKDEFESDRIGSTLVAMAGYDPTALRRYLLRMDEKKGEATTDVHRTHPPNGERVAAISEFLVENGLIEGASTTISKERFARYVRLN